MRLPLLISVPHAGLIVPPAAEPYCILSEQQIVQDGDEGAAEIYAIADEVAVFVTTDIARAIVDVNRAEDDRRPDGVVKTHTCWEVPVYGVVPPEEVVDALLADYYRPYHAELTSRAKSGVVLAVDCHTMAAHAPPIDPDPGVERPRLCLSNGDGTCPQEWMESLAGSLEATFDHPVSINTPFTGGYITRTHSAEMPWVQLEISRAPFMTNSAKRGRLLRALSAWCHQMKQSL